jgi:hypothetical protein
MYFVDKFKEWWSKYLNYQPSAELEDDLTNYFKAPPQPPADSDVAREKNPWAR